MSTASAGPVLAAAAAVTVTLPVKAKTDVPALPPGFPTHLKADLAWTGSDFTKSSEHVLVLNDTHHAEIKAALESYKGMCAISPL
jgi:hypothetical protein